MKEYLAVSLALGFLTSKVLGTFSTSGVPCYLHPAGDACHYRLRPDSDVCTSPQERARLSRRILLFNRTLVSLEQQLIRLGVIPPDNACSELPPVDNGGLVYSDLNLSPGASGRYICNEGYTLEPLSKRVNFTCTEDGVWDGNITQVPIRCQLSSERCDPPEDIINGTISFINNDTSNIFIGDMITYTCEPGSELQGPQERFCLRSGNWSGYEPQCLNAENSKGENPTQGKSNTVKIGASVGSVVAVLMVVLVMAIILSLLYKRRKLANHSTSPYLVVSNDNSGVNTPYVTVKQATKKINTPGKSSYRSTQNLFYKDDIESTM